MRGSISDLSTDYLNVQLGYHGIFGPAGKEHDDNARNGERVASGTRLGPRITPVTG